VHRIGRTGRAGHAGHAISFATPDQSSDVRDIEKLIRTSLPVSKHPEFSSEQFTQSAPLPAHKHPKGGHKKKDYRFRRFGSPHHKNR
jgi:ATP-dependent RNA helicase RhlE